jgi:hypothetical protein
MTDTVEVCFDLIAAGCLRLTVSGMSINSCVLSVLYKYLNTMHAVCYHVANAWRQVFCT